MDEFTGFAVGAFLLKLAAFVAAAIAIFVFARYLDRRIAKGAWKPAFLDHPLPHAIYSAGRWIGLCLLAGALFGCASASAADVSAGQGVPRKYDAAIERAVARYWPDLPAPALWKAQLWQESRLRADAVSPVGARGLAQFMPATWREAVRALGLGISSPHDDIAVEAGAWYQAKMRRAWTAKRTALERHALGLASYNAGLGNILKAQTRCSGARLWPDVARCLPAITGARNARETTTYVELIIGRWWPMMEALR